MNKEANQIPASIRLPQRRVNILAPSMSFLNKTETRRIAENFHDLSLTDTMLPQKLLHNVFKPDEAGNLQISFPDRTTHFVSLL
ncbi:MAG TPA: hypothetical protein VGB73_05290 [Pyrinomonadaceae bacterium]|jgi:hypothetical protein